MTERLYYTDSHRTSFEGTVVESGDLAGRPFVVLDRSAFYPTTGGQPHDTGTLGGRRVVDVVDREADGAVLHVLDGALAVGASVPGAVDWPRRLDHMQQHTGQHVLSAVFLRTCGIPTVSFHLGAESSTIDLHGTPDVEAIGQVELEANRAIWEDRAVSVRFVSAEEAATLPLRKEPVRSGTLRLVEIEGVDLSACGGTHVTRTGAIGSIAVQSWERYKGGTRVSFACGGRAVAAYRASRDQVAAAVRRLSIQPAELSEAVGRLQADLKEARGEIRTLTGQLAAFEADELARAGEVVHGTRLVCRVLDGRDAGALKALAQAITARAGHAVALVGSAPLVVVVARSADVRADAAQVVKALVERFGGRGGGRAEAAQAGGLDAAPDDVRSAAAGLLSSQLA